MWGAALLGEWSAVFVLEKGGAVIQLVYENVFQKLIDSIGFPVNY